LYCLEIEIINVVVFIISSVVVEKVVARFLLLLILLRAQLVDSVTKRKVAKKREWSASAETARMTA
jgi:hypothetical protein